MDLVQLAKDPDSGRINCPSVWRDTERGWEDLLVQGQGEPTDTGRARVHIKAGVVAEALGDRAADLAVRYNDEVTVTGVEFDVTALPDPQPGERAVWSTADELLGKLRAIAPVGSA